MRHIIKSLSILTLLCFLCAPAKAATKRGDVNKDGNVNITDVTMLVDIILGKRTDYDVTVADINKDGRVNIVDVTKLLDIILGKEPGTETGDFNDDPATEPVNAPKRNP